MVKRGTRNSTDQNADLTKNYEHLGVSIESWIWVHMKNLYTNQRASLTGTMTFNEQIKESVLGKPKLDRSIDVCPFQTEHKFVIVKGISDSDTLPHV